MQVQRKRGRDVANIGIRVCQTTHCDWATEPWLYSGYGIADISSSGSENIFFSFHTRISTIQTRQNTSIHSLRHIQNTSHVS